jgi:hypothetical protein
MSFFDGDDHDSGSVRRYRMNLGKNEDENEKPAKENLLKSRLLMRSKTNWARFKSYGGDE